MIIQTSGDEYSEGVFRSQSGHFSIKIPGFPTQIQDYLTDVAKQKNIDTGKMFIWQFEKTLYTLFYLPSVSHNGDPQPQTLANVENGTRKGIINGKAKITSEKPFKFGEYPGTEFRYDSLQGLHYISRAFLVGETGYQVVGAYRNDADEKQVLGVLDSFKLIKAK